MGEHGFDTMCIQYEQIHVLNGCPNPTCEPQLGGRSPHPAIMINCPTPDACQELRFEQFKRKREEGP